jgi:hypothetical protein
MVNLATGNSLKASFAVLVVALLLTGCGGSASPLRQADLGGISPPIVVTVLHLTDWTVTLASADELDQVTLYFQDGTSEKTDLDGRLDVVHSENDSQMTYLKASTKGGDYWYFDRSGGWLPLGYRPKFGSSLSSKGASTVWVDGNQLDITCSDAYSEVKVYYADDTTETFDTSAGTETSRSFNLLISSVNVDAIRIRLTGDGSLYYYGPDGNALPAGTKWYEDAD